MVEPLAVGLSGLALLALTHALGLRSTAITWAVAITAVVWIVLSARLKRAYSNALQVALSRRHLEGVGLVIDAESAAVLERGLASVHPGEVVLSLRLMEQREHPRFASAISESARRDDPIVAIHAIDRIRELGLVAATDVIRARMEEGAPEVRGAAIRAYCALLHESAVEPVTPLLRAHEPAVRRGAAVGLLRSCGPEGVAIATALLDELVASDSAEERRAAADIIGSAEITSLSLKGLLRDRDRAVRTAALVAAGKLRSLSLVEPLLAVIDRPDMRDGASRALVAIGDEVLPALEAACRKRGSLRGRLISVYARIGTAQALQALANALGEGSATVDHAILESLVRAGFRPQTELRPRLHQRVLEEARGAAWSLAAAADLDGDDEILRRALASERGAKSEMVLSLLALLFSEPNQRRAMIEVRRKYSYGTSDNRAAAIETLDNMLPADLRAAVLPVLEGTDRVAARSSRSDRIAEIVARPLALTHAWTKTCALALVDKPISPDLERAIEQAIRGSDRMVREAALATAQRLDLAAAMLALDVTAPGSIDLASTIGVKMISPLSPQKRAGSMLLTIEKVMILKSVALFGGLPESMLADVAGALAEAEVRKGDRIVEQGTVGTAMYIIVSGAVSLTSGGNEIATLGPRQVFGELAALDPSPRTATATATEETHLFRIEADVLYELMSDSTDFTRALVASLIRRLRDAQRR